jgi:ATP-dependent DNA ligase
VSVIGCESRAATTNPWQTATPSWANELCGLVDHATVLDSEVVTLDEQGRPDFGLLQQRSTGIPPQRNC